MFKNIWQHPKTSLVGLLIAIVAVAPVLEKADWAHLTATSIVGLITAIATTLLGLFAKDPGSSGGSGASTSIFVLGFLLVAGAGAFAQTPPAAPANNLYAFGVSYNNANSPSVDGTALYARLVAANSSSTTQAGGITTTSAYPTYAFTALDILPVNLKPLTVTTNMSVGVAQQVLSLSGMKFFIPVSAGLSTTGTATGYNWTSGVLADYTIKKKGVATHWHIMPNVRWLNVNVSGASVYQVTGGILIGLDQ